MDFIQPPNILPISSIIVCKAMYFFKSITWTSLASLKVILNKFNFALTPFKIGSFSVLGSWLANSIFSA